MQVPRGYAMTCYIASIYSTLEYEYKFKFYSTYRPT